MLVVRKKRRIVLPAVILLALLQQGCKGAYRTELSPPGTLSIVRKPPPADYSGLAKSCTELPRFKPDPNAWDQLDYRSSDLSRLDLHDRLPDLIHVSFDSRTKWPASLPAGYDPREIMRIGKNPGLNLRKLHSQGVTGSGVGLAIIDQALLVDHEEYRDSLKLYEEIHCGDYHAQMHGPAVASIAVGKTVGVAPGADLYYIAETHGTYGKNGFDWDLQWLAKSIDRVVAINKTLKRNKIRVISISLGKNPQWKNYEELEASIARAEKEGLYVIMVDGAFMGGDRQPLADPDRFESYEAGFFWSNRPYNNSYLIVPMDSRCTAAPNGTRDYVFYRFGGMSWAVPYVAGLYALACQVKPDITPEAFREAAFKTGVTTRGGNGEFGVIVNPGELITDLRRTNG